MIFPSIEIKSGQVRCKYPYCKDYADWKVEFDIGDEFLCGRHYLVVSYLVDNWFAPLIKLMDNRIYLGKRAIHPNIKQTGRPTNKSPKPSVDMAASIHAAKSLQDLAAENNPYPGKTIYEMVEESYMSKKEEENG